MYEKEYDYEQLNQERLKEDDIIESLKIANEKNIKCRYSEEQVLCAQEGKARKEINELHYYKIFPLTNIFLYIVFYLASLFILPLLYSGGSQGEKYVAVVAYVLLICVAGIVKLIDKYAKSKKRIRKNWMCLLEKFSSDTTVFTYLLTSLGYMLVFMDAFAFWFIYIIMVIVFAFAMWFDVIKPLISKSNAQFKN